MAHPNRTKSYVGATIAWLKKQYPLWKPKVKAKHKNTCAW